jgi:aminoglycoside phosphotransferase family enzyme/predicted kinase
MNEQFDDHLRANDRVARLVALAEALRDGPDWASSERPIDLVQTHISVVLVGREHVLKLKKPVDFGFLDYTTLEKRRDACEAELRLNRRLCHDVYLDVRPIWLDGGTPRMGERGEAVDYGVWMRRLPSDRMLDALVERGEATEAIVDRIAARLASFHRDARRGPEVDACGRVEVVSANCEENFVQSAPFAGETIDAEALRAIERYTRAWLASNRRLLDARIAEGRIRDGHGDVRCESVCVEEEISIFDCIEFNERFRFGDVASEVAFLAMDLAVRGRPDLGYYFAERYADHARDAALFSVLAFYQCYRAFVRGKVLSFEAAEREVDAAERERAAVRARDYFDFARRYAAPLAARTIVAVTGLSGTGKTSVARAIGHELGLRVVSADAVRRALFGDISGAEYDAGPYTPEANAKTYREMIDAGGRLAAETGGVVLDATFRRREDLDAARAMASEIGADWRIVECRLRPDAVRERLERRATSGEGISAATWATYLRQRDESDPAVGAADPKHLVLDTSASVERCGATASDWLRERATASN